MKLRLEATQKLFMGVDVEVPFEIADDDVAAWITKNMDSFDWKDYNTKGPILDSWERL